MTSCYRNVFDVSAHQRPTVGDIKMGIVNRDHLGWLLCDGRPLPVQQYYHLFSVIGYSFSPVPNLSTFNLPNPAGTVPGIIGTGTDSRLVSTIFNLGQQYGEYEHVLITAELATHNHTGQTLYMSTGMTINTSTTGVYDSGHTHGYTAPGNARTYDVDLANQNAGTTGATTGTGNAAIVDPGHTHAYNDPTHRHVIPNDGANAPHNNIQPTLAIGNMFVYSGYGLNSSGKKDPLSFPYGAGTNLF